MEKHSNNSKENTKGKSQAQTQAKPQAQNHKSSTEFAKEICPKK